MGELVGGSLVVGEEGGREGRSSGEETYAVEEDEEGVGAYTVAHDEREEVSAVEGSCRRASGALAWTWLLKYARAHTAFDHDLKHAVRLPIARGVGRDARAYVPNLPADQSCGGFVTWGVELRGILGPGNAPAQSALRQKVTMKKYLTRIVTLARMRMSPARDWESVHVDQMPNAVAKGQPPVSIYPSRQSI